MRQNIRDTFSACQHFQWFFFVAPSEWKKELIILLDSSICLPWKPFIKDISSWSSGRDDMNTEHIVDQQKEARHLLTSVKTQFDRHSFTEPEAFHTGTRRENSSCFGVSRSTQSDKHWKTSDDLLRGTLYGFVSGDSSLWWTSSHVWTHWNTLPCFLRFFCEEVSAQRFISLFLKISIEFCLLLHFFLCLLFE